MQISISEIYVNRRDERICNSSTESVLNPAIENRVAPTARKTGQARQTNKGSRKVARPERFELPTARFVAEYSIQLSYGRIDLI